MHEEGNFFFDFFVFFFQAEDGIRDLVRSRGLGDVYKRQALRRAAIGQDGVELDLDGEVVIVRRLHDARHGDAVGVEGVALSLIHI